MTSAKSTCSFLLRLGGIGVLALACAHAPDPREQRVRASYAAASQDPKVQQYASVELYEAKEALDELAQAVRNEDDEAELEHRARVAQQRVDIARVAAEGGALEAQAENLTETRDRLRLRAREHEAQSAHNRAAAAEAAAADAQREVDEMREQAQLSELDAAEARAQSAEERAMSAEEELSRLNAKETERGLVLTLGSGLFATDRSELQTGAMPELDRIANYLEDHGDRDVLIEGHTDDVGAEQYNLGLSQRRAQAVADYLTAHGIARDRIRIQGLGEARPIAPNDSPAGRQQNRRVEVVILQ